MSKKLISLNIAIFLIIALFANAVLTFAASTSTQSITIDGKEYNADEAAGSETLGWNYYPGEPAKLDIWSNYSGLPISVPGDVIIRLNGNITGNETIPAVTVDGNAAIYACGLSDVKNVQVKGAGSNPGILATGEVSLKGISEEDESFVIQGGGTTAPAISASKVSFYDKVFYTGLTTDALTADGIYTDEHILKLVPGGVNYSVTLKKGEVLSAPPQHNEYVFIGWKTTENNKEKWFMPGDTLNIEGESIVLNGVYVDSNRTTVAVVLDGNGGLNENNSKYVVTLASTHELSLYNIPKAPFTKENDEVRNFNSRANGDGTVYTESHKLKDDKKTFAYTLYAQWKATAPYVESTVKANGTSYEITTVLSNIETGAVVIAAGYKENVLVDIKYNSKGLPNVLSGDIDEIRVMVWKNIGSIIPLYDEEIINKSQFIAE